MTYYHDYDFGNLGAGYGYTPYNAYTYGNASSRWGWGSRAYGGWSRLGAGYDSPYARNAWHWNNAQHSSLHRSRVNSALNWGRETSENVLRHSLFRLRNETAVDHVFRRF
jgi:hypothetical protein